MFDRLNAGVVQAGDTIEYFNVDLCYHKRTAKECGYFEVPTDTIAAWVNGVQRINLIEHQIRKKLEKVRLKAF